MKRRVLVSIVLILILSIITFAWSRKKENGEQFRTAPVKRGEIQAKVTATGTVNAVITVQVGTQVSGRIQHLYADFNTPVKKGDLIAQIDPALFEAQYEQAKANLISAKANVKKAEAALLDSKRIRDRYRKLVEEGVIPQSEFDTSETNYEAAEAQLASAKAQVEVSEAALKLAETNLFYTKIISPVDGIVISRNVDVGQTVAASFQTPTLFVIAKDLTKMEIDTKVSEADIGKVQVGNPVEFTVDAYPELVFKGTVSQVRNAPITVQNVVTYDVIIVVDNPDLKLKPGMTANVSIIYAKKNGILMVPNAALRFKPSDHELVPIESKGAGVWILDKGKLKRVSLKTGISDGENTEIMEGNLKEGQEVIIGYLVKKKVVKKPPAPRGFLR